MKQWYENINFWAELQQKLFTPEHSLLAEFEIDTTLLITDTKPKANVLDLCCGPGRHSIPLAKKGYNVTGVDLNENYLMQAKSKAKELNLNVNFIQKMMNEYISKDTFDLIINMYSSFGFFQDQKDDIQVLQNCFLSLRKGGKLFLDMMGKEIIVKNYQQRDWQEFPNAIYLEERTIIGDWEALICRWIKISNGITKEFHFFIRLYSAAEIKKLLLEVGFSNVTVYGSFSRGSYNQNAQRLLVIAEK
jgi:SAM-dependent methyltransferase